MGKQSACINHKKEYIKSCLRVYWLYTKKEQPKNGVNGSRKPTIPRNYLYPNQVKKSNKDLSLSPLYTLDQDQKLQMKELFNLYAENAFLSKVTLFLLHQTDQKRQRGAAFHTFLHFLPTRDPCQERRTCHTKKGKTHPIPTIAIKAPRAF